MKLRYISHFLPVTLALALSGCGEDVSPPWESDKRSTKPVVNNNSNPRIPTTPTGTDTNGGSNTNAQPPLYNGNNNNSSASQGDLFQSGLYDARGNQISPSQLQGKHVGILFSAHWNPACHDFSPKMVNFRNQNASKFEVVFVSLCNSQAEKDDYMSEMGMSWLTTPGSRTEQGAALANQFNVQQIPHLVVLNPNGKVVSQNGITDVERNPGRALSNWK